MKNTDELLKDGEKLKNIRKSLNLTQEEFAKELDTTQGYIGMIEKGQRAISSSIKYNLLQKIGIDWNISVASGDDLLKRIKITEQYKPFVGIPYYEAKVAAGGGFENVSYPDNKLLYFDKRWLENVLNVQPEHLSIVKATGDSMLPTIQDGDLLIVDDSNLNVINNKVYVIRQDNLYRVKRLKKEIDGTVRIISDNPQYSPETINKETTIIGRVIWNGSKENV